MLNERRTQIREYIDIHGEATVAELLELCGGISSMTLWRDLNFLEQEGAIRRTRGGAISMRSIQPDIEGLYNQRAQEHTAEKRAIARAAVQFVEISHAVYMDAGSTLMCVARLLPDQHFTIITSGANIAIELSQRKSCNVISVGGQISGNTLSFSGPQAEAFIDQVNIDTALMATSGCSLSAGFTSGSFSEQQLKRKVIEKASRVVMLMDHGKIGRSLPFTFAGFADIDVLVTDAPLPAEVEASAQKHGVRVVVAEEIG